MDLTLIGTLIEVPAAVRSGPSENASGPTSACQDSSFPTGATTIPFTLNAGSQPKQVGVSTGAKIRNVNSPSSFVQLSGVGTGDDVTQGATFYIRVVSGLFQVRCTYHNPAGSPIVSVSPIAGLFIQEADVGNGFYLQELEIQGSGIVEYYVSGPQ